MQKQIQPIIFLFALIPAAMLTACGGGGGGGGGGSDAEFAGNQPDSVNSLVVINEQNAAPLSRHAVNSTAVALKLAVQLQSALNSFALSDQSSLDHPCESSGNITVSIAQPSGIQVIFQACHSSSLEESFDGALTFFPDAIFSNGAAEVSLGGLVEIAAPITLGTGEYTSLSGGFEVRLQSTLQGETLLLNSHPSESLRLVNPRGTLDVESMEIDVEYDLDRFLLSVPEYFFYGTFDLALASTELGGRFSCDTTEEFGVGLLVPEEFEIYCSGSVDRGLLLSGGSFTNIDISLLNSGNNQYESASSIRWEDFTPLFQYRPVTPQPELQIATIASREFNIPINDAVYSASLDRFYIAVPDNAPQYAGHLVEMHPQSGAVTRGIALKGAAQELGISPGGQILYLGYKNFSEVQRLALDTFSLGEVLQLGTRGPTEEQLFAEEIAVSSESDDIVAIATYTDGNIHSPKSIQQFQFFRSGVKAGVFNSIGSVADSSGVQRGWQQTNHLQRCNHRFRNHPVRDPARGTGISGPST